MPQEKKDAYAAKVVENMEKATGKSLAEWVAILKGSGVTGHGNQVKWLKTVHGINHTGALMIAWKLQEETEGPGPSQDEVLEAQYAGPKAALRPIYEKLRAAITEIDPDVNWVICKTYVAAERKRQFAALQPSTRTRFDLGLVMPEGMEAGGRLLPAKNVGSGRISHMVALTSPDEVDAQLIDWLRMAFETGK